MPNPLRPGSHKYPTGQRLNISLAFVDNKKRWQRAAKRINDVVRALPYEKQQVPDSETPKVRKQDKRTAMLTNHLADSRYIWANKESCSNSSYKVKDAFSQLVINECKIFSSNAVKYDYLVDSALMDRTMDTVGNILVDDLLSGYDFWTRRFWLDAYVDKAVEDGTVGSFESALLITQDAPVEENFALLNARQRLSTPAYLDRLRLVHGRVFEEMKGLTAEMKSQLRLVLTEGMARGVGIRDLTGMINKRMSVGLVRAERIARTEINKAYRDAYMNESKDLNETALKDDDWKIMQAHRSALSPTTRKHHAERHGNIYTAEQQQNWWSEDANAINCLCSTLDVLVNKKTGEVLQSKMIKTMKKQKGEWFGL